MSDLVGSSSEALAAEPAFVLSEFAVHRGHVYCQVTGVGQEFTAERTLRPRLRLLGNTLF